MDQGADGRNASKLSRDGVLEPIGQSLRTTFDPVDGEVLQPAITSLMIELSREEFELNTRGRDTGPPQSASTEAPNIGIRAFLARLLRRRA